MKHAILILAHKNITLLCKILKYFDNQCDIFIHIDKKSSFTLEDINSLYKYRNVKKVYQKFAVHWGGFSMLKSELDLLKLALKESDATYFHLISGQDYPIKPLNVFIEFFERHNGKNFLEFKHIPFAARDGNGYFRFQYYMPYDWVDARNKKGKDIIHKCYKWQKKIGIKRRIPDQFYHLYGGSQWFSITREGAETLLCYTRKSPAFYRRMKYTFASEESYITTVLVNLLPQAKIVNNNLRYIRWLKENGNNPSNLGKEHFSSIINSNAFFARKMENPYYKPLIELIDKYLLPNTTFEISETGSWIYNSYHLYHFDANLAMAIVQLYRLMELKSAIDVGCGIGTYVVALRKYGIPIIGFDGNPYCTELSSIITPDKNFCMVADLTDELDEDDIPFDLVLCLDVLSYIPEQHINKAIFNLAKLSKKYIIISCETHDKKIPNHAFALSIQHISNILHQYNFKNKIAITEYLREAASSTRFKQSLYLFEKRNT